MEWEQADHVGVTRAGRVVAPRARGFAASSRQQQQLHRLHEDALATPDEDEQQPADASSSSSSLSSSSPSSSSSPPAFQEDVARGRFPYSIVWTPIPVVTWLLPFVGHLGICDSRGVIYDFAGPYTISVDSFAFGEPARVLRLRPELAAAPPAAAGESAAQRWDRCVDRGCDVYVGRMHAMLVDDCHDHVARCLNEMRYGGSGAWNKVSLAARLFFAGSFVSPQRALAAYLPALVIWAAIALLLRVAW